MIETIPIASWPARRHAQTQMVLNRASEFASDFVFVVGQNAFSARCNVVGGFRLRLHDPLTSCRLDWFWLSCLSWISLDPSSFLCQRHQRGPFHYRGPSKPRGFRLEHCCERSLPLCWE